MRRFFAMVAAAATGLVGCGGPDSTEAGQSSQAQTEACPALSPLGQAIAAAADNGRSTTTSAIVTKKNRVVGGPIVGGKEFGEAMFDLVSSAKTDVIVQSFLIDDGFLASRLRDAIQTLPPELPVHVLLSVDYNDGRGGQASPQQTADRVHEILDPRNARNVIVRAWQSGGVFWEKINHDKSIIVDRQRVLVSNINMEFPSDPRGLPGGRGNSWYQLGVLLEGEIAQVAASEAATAWGHAGAIAASRPQGRTASVVPTSPAPTPPNTCVPMIALGREAGSGGESSADQGFLALFQTAKNALRVMSPNLNSDLALGGLVKATNNADVYVVLSKGFGDFMESLGQGGSNEHVVQARLPGLLAAGGNACRLHVRWYAAEERPGVAVDGIGDNASHAKYASADAQVVVVGSQNMDTQSWQTSREFSVAIDDRGATAAFDAAFEKVWDRSACAFECGGCPTR